MKSGGKNGKTGPKILLTGGTGFLGNILFGELRKKKDTEVIRLGRKSDNEIQCDLSHEVPTLPAHDLLIHLAGLAHLKDNARNERPFFANNVTATKNLLKGLDFLVKKPVSIIFISTVAVYGLDSGRDISEQQPTRPQSAYGRSKLEAEQLMVHYGQKQRIPVLILRLPLVWGVDPPGNFGKMIRALKKGYYLKINRGSARRSVVSAKQLANHLLNWIGKEGRYHLCSDRAPSYAEIEDFFCQKYQLKNSRRLPLLPARLLAWAGDISGDRLPFNSEVLKKMTSDLIFNDQKARDELAWKGGEWND